jgi:hypothetical protein
VLGKSGFDEIVLELQEQIDDMLRFEHNILQVANSRPLQLRQQVRAHHLSESLSLGMKMFSASLRRHISRNAFRRDPFLM